MIIQFVYVSQESVQDLKEGTSSDDTCHQTLADIIAYGTSQMLNEQVDKVGIE